MDLQVFPIPIPPPTSLSTDSSGSSQCTRPEHLSHASSLGWWTWCSYILSLEKTHQSFFLLFHPNQNLLLLFAIILCLVAQSCYFAAPWTVVRQASLSMGFYRQEYCNGLPFPPPAITLQCAYFHPTTLNILLQVFTCLSCFSSCQNSGENLEFAV